MHDCSGESTSGDVGTLFTRSKSAPLAATAIAAVIVIIGRRRELVSEQYSPFFCALTHRSGVKRAPGDRRVFTHLSVKGREIFGGEPVQDVVRRHAMVRQEGEPLILHIVLIASRDLLQRIRDSARHAGYPIRTALTDNMFQGVAFGIFRSGMIDAPRPF